MDTSCSKFLGIALFLFSAQITLPSISFAADIPVQFDAPLSYPAGNSAYDVAVDDFNGDGYLDLAVSGYNNTSILFGNSDGSFQAPISYPAGGSMAVVRSADFNGDGKHDMAITKYSSTGTISILINSGNGTFLPKVDYPSGGDAPTGMITGDFNGDGKIDLAVANNGNIIVCINPPCPQPQTTINVAVLLGNGDGTFQTAIPSTVTGKPWSLTAIEANGDGVLDLAIGTQNSLYLLNGLGNGSFQSPIYIANSSTTISELHTADLNRDSIQDLISVDSNGSESIRIGTGNGQFRTPTYHTAGLNLLIRDIDGDGIPDMAGTGNNYLYLSLGKGDGTFYPSERYVGTGTLKKMVAVDVDRNGLTDLAVANYGTSSVSVFLNKGLKLATPSSASFGWVDMNATSAPKNFTIANSTGAPLSVASVITAGTDSAMFTVAPGGNTPCPGLSPTLAQGERCTVQGTFTPSAFGNRSASLVISSNHPVTPEFSIPLTGSVNPYILQINWTGTGSGSVNILPMPSTTYTSGPVNLSYYSDNQTVTLQATPGANASFGGWSGCDSIGGNLCAATMNRSKTLSVNFQQIISCTSNIQCGSGNYCLKPTGSCGDTGTCVPWNPGGVCVQVVAPICGCNGVTYSNSCYAAIAGVSIAYNGSCSINSCYASYQSAIEHGAICWGTNTPSEILYANLLKTVVIGGGAVLKGIVVSNGVVEVNGVTLQ